MGLVSMACDVAVILLGVELFGLSKLNGVTAGATVGAVVSFVLNRVFAFRAHTHWLPQAMRYFGVFSLEVLIHRHVLAYLLKFSEWPYMLHKFLADALVFGILHLLAMRLFIFGKPQVAAEKTSTQLS